MDDGFLQQLVHGDLPPGEGVILPADAHERLPVQKDIVEIGLVKKALYHCKIQLIFLQQPQKRLRVVHDQGQGVVGVFEVAADVGFQIVVADGFGGPDAQGADGVVFQLLLEILLLQFRRSCVFFQYNRRLGFHQTAVFVLEQLSSVLIFQIMNLLRHGGLGNVENFGGFPVIHGFTQGQKGVDTIVQHDITLIKNYNHFIRIDKLILSYSRGTIKLSIKGKPYRNQQNKERWK